MEKEIAPVLEMKSIVAKNVDLSSQMAKFDLSELRLIAFCLAHYDSRKDDNHTFIARVCDLAKTFCMDQKSAYAVMRKVMIGLGKKPLEVRVGNRVKYRNWFSGFDYIEGEGEFEFFINPDVQPYLLGLEGSFTKYRLADVYQFKSASTWKMYELLKSEQFKKSGKFEIKLDELRLLLGVAGKYTRWGELHRRIIEPAIAEINATSDIKVKYLPYRRGRQIAGIEFKIDNKKPEDAFTIDLETEAQALYKLLVKKAGISCKTSQQFVTDARELEKVSLLLNKVPLMLENAAKRGACAAQYVAGSVNKELYQGKLFEEKDTRLGAAKKHNLSTKEMHDLANQSFACLQQKNGNCTAKKEDVAICDVCVEQYQR